MAHLNTLGLIVAAAIVCTLGCGSGSDEISLSTGDGAPSPAVAASSPVAIAPTPDTDPERDVPEPETPAEPAMSHRDERLFAEVAMAELPLLMVETPKAGEVWISIKPEASPRTKEIMAQVAELHREVDGYAGDIDVMLWVSGRAIMKLNFPAPDDGRP